DGEGPWIEPRRHVLEVFRVPHPEDDGLLFAGEFDLRGGQGYVVSLCKTYHACDELFVSPLLRKHRDFTHAVLELDVGPEHRNDPHPRVDDEGQHEQSNDVAQHGRALGSDGGSLDYRPRCTALQPRGLFLRLNDISTVTRMGTGRPASLA